MLRDEFYSAINSGELNYYDINLHDYIVDFDEDTIKNVIIRYFEMGGKKELFSFKDISFLPDLRWLHSFSLFVLGDIIGKAIIDRKSIIDRIISQFKGLTGFDESRFAFYWFLCVLFHDVGYSISEKNKNRSIDLNRLRRYYHISHLLYGKSVRIMPFKTKYYKHPFGGQHSNNNDAISPRTNIDIHGITHVYKFESKIENTKSVVTDYFDAFRNHINPKYREHNHGVIGGEMFFSFLCEEYARNYREVLTKDENAIFDNFNNGMLIWKIQLLDIYRIIGDIIISHSIWSIPTEDNASLYRDYQLNRLPHFKMKLSLDNPLLFLLCLVDTIDPVKFFIKNRNLSFDTILDMVDINIVDNSIEIYSKELVYLEHLHNIKINAWMNVHVSEVRDNKIIIQIHE